MVFVCRKQKRCPIHNEVGDLSAGRTKKLMHHKREGHIQTTPGVAQWLSHQSIFCIPSVASGPPSRQAGGGGESFEHKGAAWRDPSSKKTPKTIHTGRSWEEKKKSLATAFQEFIFPAFF